MRSNPEHSSQRRRRPMVILLGVVAAALWVVAVLAIAATIGFVVLRRARARDRGHDS